ncbi:MAG: RluA family pseudouridine synthase [Rikenellaceae bacterium]
MFDKKRIIYEDNHLIAVNKLSGELVQSDADGNPGLEDTLKDFIKVRDSKPGAVYLGVIHRIDRPVSGVVIFSKTSKALTRMNEMVKKRQITKQYMAITESAPKEEVAQLRHFIKRNSSTNRSVALDYPAQGAKEAVLEYELICASKNYYLLAIKLISGRHHQIRAQLSKIGCAIKGDLKYGSPRSNKDGSISLHARSLEFAHPVTKQNIKIVAPVPSEDNLWVFFKESLGE